MSHSNSFNQRIRATFNMINRFPFKKQHAPFLLVITAALFMTMPSLAQDTPTFFKVYSKDGRENLSASCRMLTETVIRCNFRNVRFMPPSKKEAVGIGNILSSIKKDPKLRSDLEKEYGKKGKELESIVKGELEKGKGEFCSGSGKAEIENKIRSPLVGPKRKKQLLELLDACSVKDPGVFYKALDNLFEGKTCTVFVDAFSLEFKKIGKGKWLSNEGAAGVCDLVKIYELEQDEGRLLWNLSETRLTAGDTTSTFCKGLDEELGKKTVWSWKNPKDWELPRDFIGHSLIQFP